MSKRLSGVGQKVEEARFAAELKSVFDKVNSFGRTVEKAASRGEEIRVDESDLNAMVLQIVGVARDNGLKIPREFALLIKQFLYFDRYAQILAPGMNVYSLGEASRPGGQPKFFPKG